MSPIGILTILFGLPMAGSPLSPADALNSFEIQDGFRIELVACEPEVIDPVSIAFDENGWLYVVEMTDYPNGPKPGEPPRSRIRILQDLDSDGKMETSHLFADQLLFATGILPWQGGVVVCVGGEVLYLKDTDHDFKADQKEIWLQGFAQQNPQLRCNHPRLSWDGWILFANGLRGGKISANRALFPDGGRNIELGQQDFQFHPHTGKIQLVAGLAQFGQALDQFGRRYVCSNRNPCKQVMIENRYLREDRFVPIRSLEVDIAPAGEDSRIFPISKIWTTSNLHEGQFTAACGVLIYRGGLWDDAWIGASLTCDPTGNLVHAERYRPQGATYSEVRRTEDREFLASTDPWFRPVDLYEGPEGAVYVVDMYRAVIEHPEWMPEELRNRPDLNDGNDRGRIYRIVPNIDLTGNNDGRGNQEKIPYSKRDVLALLRDPRAWVQDLGMRRVYEAKSLEEETVLGLRGIIEKGAFASSRARALAILSNRKKEALGSLLEQLNDPHPGVREWIVRAAETIAETSKPAQSTIIRHSKDEDPRVRYQAAWSLGIFRNKEGDDALLEIARERPDEWTRLGILFSIEQPQEFLVKVAPFADFALLEGIGRRIGYESIRDPRLDWMTKAVPLQSQLAAINGLAEGIAANPTKDPKVILQLIKEYKPDSVQPLIEHALELQGSPVKKLQQLRFLKLVQGSAFLQQLVRELDRDHPIEVRQELIRTIASTPGPELARVLLERLPRETPALRRQIVTVLVDSPEMVRTLLDSIASREVSAGVVEATESAKLRKHPNEEIRLLSEKVLPEARFEDRKKVLADYVPALKLDSSADRGRLIFRKNCTQCHRIEGEGVRVGPDISDTRTKTKEQLLQDILHPNAAVDGAYQAYSLELKSGQTLTGLVHSETAVSLTLTLPEGKTEQIRRGEIVELNTTGQSLMPEGIEKEVTVEQMADLLDYLKNWRYLDGQIPALNTLEN